MRRQSPRLGCVVITDSLCAITASVISYGAHSARVFVALCYTLEGESAGTRPLQSSTSPWIKGSWHVSALGARTVPHSPHEFSGSPARAQEAEAPWNNSRPLHHVAADSSDPKQASKQASDARHSLRRPQRPRPTALGSKSRDCDVPRSDGASLDLFLHLHFRAHSRAPPPPVDGGVQVPKKLVALSLFPLPWALAGPCPTIDVSNSPLLARGPKRASSVSASNKS